MTALLLLFSVCSHTAEPPTLILMGGSYSTHSSLLAEDCRPEQRTFPGAREAPQHRIAPERFTEILDPAYWQARPGAALKPIHLITTCRSTECIGDTEPDDASKSLSAKQDLPSLQPAVFLAQKMGARLGSGEILFRTLPAGSA